MLVFFRKYEKGILSVVASLLVITLVFFGTYQKAAPNVRKRVDRKLGHYLDGSPISELELDRIAFFLAPTDAMLPGLENSSRALHGEFAVEELFKTRLLLPIAKCYFSTLQPELEERFVKIKRFIPYIHPKAPMISARRVWRQFVPRIEEILDELQKRDKMDFKSFELMVELYTQQLALPPTHLKKILLYLQNQLSHLPPDFSLADRDLSLFGFHRLQDWFGRTFVDLMAETVKNGALYAKQKGYKVSYREAKNSLVNYLEQDDRQVSLSQCLAYFGISEQEMVQLWREILLWRTYFNDTKGFDASTVEGDLYKVRADLYKVPGFTTFNDLMKFQLYLAKVSGIRVDSYELPSHFRPVEQLQKESPELVERSYKISYRSVSKKELMQGISTKEMLRWQSENRPILDKQFNFLKGRGLDHLSLAEKAALDSFSLNHIIENDPSRALGALTKATANELVITFTHSGEMTPYLPILHPEKFEAVINRALTESQLYSDEGENYYQISLLEGKSYRIMEFATALEFGLLDEALDSYLAKRYPDIRSRSPDNFKDEKGGWKPLDQVRELVGIYAFSSLLRSIDEDVSKQFPVQWQEGMGPIDFYTSHRFYKPFSEYRALLKRQLLEGGKVEPSPTLQNADLANFWQATLEEVVIDASHPLYSQVTQVDLLSLPTTLEGSLCFFRPKDREKDEGLMAKKREEALAHYLAEEREKRMKELVQAIREKDAIVLIDRHQGQ